MTNYNTHLTEIINHITKHPETLSSILPLIESMLGTEGWAWNDIVELLNEVMEYFKSECGESVIVETIYSFINLTGEFEDDDSGWE